MKIIFKYFPQAKFPADFFPAEAPELPAKMHRKTACCGTSAPRRLPPVRLLPPYALPFPSASSSLIRLLSRRPFPPAPLSPLPYVPTSMPGSPHRPFQRRCPFPRCRALRPRPSSHTAILLLPSSFSPGRPFSPIHCRPVPDIPSRRAASPAFLLCTRAPSPSAPARSRQENHHGPHPRPPRPRDEPRNFHPDSRPPETPRPRKGDLPRQAILYTVAQ